MRGTDPTILITKVLLPRRRDDVLTRQRLLNRLYDMVDYKLALVSAPAGYGKTTLLVDFATDLEHPVCWYALDASDHDPHLFLQRLVMSIRRRFSGFGEETLRALAAGADLSGGAPSVVRVLVNEIVTQIPRWFVIVLDDYDALGPSAEVDAIISNFVAAQRDQCLTVIASRTVPKLPLIIPLVARGGVGGIGQDEMRFTPEEVQALFAHNYDTELTLDDATELADQVEGWITGLLLTAYTCWEGVLQSWMRARDSREPIYDYLAQEVFAQQPEALQAFLEVTSTLAEMNLQLCEALLQIDDAEALLEATEGRSLFVTRLEGDWFRYHHLFRDFLQNRLRHRDAELWATLHLRAAEWFEAHDQALMAVTHYMTVDAIDRAARLMSMIAQDLYVKNQLTTLMTWREHLPVATLTACATLAIYISRAAYKLGDRDAAISLARIAEEGYRAAHDDEGLAYALLQRCEVWLYQAKLHDALALSRETLGLIEATGVPVVHEAHRMLGRIYVSLGDLAQGHMHLQRALEAGEAGARDYDKALIRTGLAQCLGLLGRLDEAVVLHREAVEIWRRLGGDAGLADELCDLGYHLYRQGDYDQAMRALQEALTLSHQTGLRRAEALALVNLGELARDLGLFEQAADYLERGHALAMEIEDRLLAPYSLEALGLVYRAQSRYSEAHEALSAAFEVAISQGSEYQAGCYQASMGAVLAESGDVSSGRRAVEDALAAIAPSGSSPGLTRAKLLHAWVLFLAEERDAALAELNKLLDGRGGSDLDQVLVTEGAQVAPLYKAARTAFKGEKSKTQTLRQIDHRVKNLDAAGRRLFPGETATVVPDRPELEVFGFGRGMVSLGGETIPATAWGSVTARHLLFYMLVFQERSREQIFADFWPELAAQKAKATFHTTKFRLHNAVGRDVIDYDGRAYILHSDLQAWFDVAAFRERLRLWRTSEDVSVLEDAVELYSGDFLSDCYLDWAVSEREVLHVRCLEALEALADRLLARRQYKRAVAALRRALTLEPARETFHQQLMRSYALSGQRSRALAQYKRCRTALAQDLGAAPSQATDDLYDRIMQEVSLD